MRFLQGAGERPPGGAAPARRAGPHARRPGRRRRTSSRSSTAASHGRVADVGRGPRRRPLARDAVRAQHDAGRRGPRPRRARWRASLLSTHPVLRHRAAGASSRRCEAPEAESVNTFPVLATDADDALLGAAIMLPDHPRLAPESRGDLFDGTEIEEALLLHVLALSDDEREAIAAADPAVRAMVARAAAATPEDIMALHGRTTLSDPAPPHAEPPGEREVERRRRHLPPGRQGRAAPRRSHATPTTASSTAASPPSSASTSTTRTSSTSA